MRCHLRRSTLPAVVVVAASLVCGCDSRSTPTLLTDAGLEESYVAVIHESYSEVLTLAEDGSFTYREGVPEGSGLGARGALLASGNWVFARDRLELTDGTWTAVFVPDSTGVAVPGRADTLSSLRWVGSSEGSPFSAVELVSRRQFRDFLHPPEGSGGEGG